MTVLVVLEGVVILLLAVLVAGLLRSHAEILRALHDLGHGEDGPGSGVTAPIARYSATDEAPTDLRDGVIQPGLGGTVRDVAGLVPGGGQRAVVVAGAPHPTLLAFLSSGCGTCAEFWSVFSSAADLGLPPDTRVVIVTKGPDAESPALVQALAPDHIPTILSSEAYLDYGVPGSPYFVMVDGPTSTIVGEGSGANWGQVVGLLQSAAADTGWATGPGRAGEARPAHLDGRARELQADAELRAAGIHPGHDSLYPSTRDQVEGIPAPEQPSESSRG